MESPVLQNTAVVENQSRKKLYLALAFAFFIFAIGFFLIVVFTYGISNVKSPAPTFNDEEPIVSAPSVAVGEPNPNTPIPVESELTYTFPQAHGFQMTYTAANWTVAIEPTQVNAYNPSGTPITKNLLRLTSTNDSNVVLDFEFRSAPSGMLNGNPTIYCTSNYTIVKELSASGQNDGLIRIKLGSGELLYARSYYANSSDSTQMCVYTSHPIYTIEKVEGGDSGQVPDTNDIYWIVSVTSVKATTQLSEIDNIVNTIKFAE